MRWFAILPLSALVTAVLMASGSAASAAEKVTLTMSEFQFAPKALTVKAGATVELTLVNKGSVLHEFMLYPPPKGMSMGMNMDEYGSKNTYFQGIGTFEVIFPGKQPIRTQRLAKVELDPGKSTTIRFSAKNTGTFEFGCHIAGHYEAGMKGALIVK